MNSKEESTNLSHKPVLLNEVIDFLNVRAGKTYVDCTLGLGGHAKEILKKLNGEGIFIGIEQDKKIFEIAKDSLKDFKNCYLFNTNFINLPEVLKSLKVQKITGGALLDLGLNSMQLADSERGFSFRNNGKLDMRMNNNSPLTAYEVVNKYSEKKLSEIIYKYGEERYSRKIARSIIIRRAKEGHIQTTGELANLVLNCYPKNKWFKIHPATKTFQAIRIEVNKELECLEKFLCFTPELLLSGSRLTVISFHSLEDRIIKSFFKKSSEFKILTKKPVIPSEDEVKNNPRARSAKLRVLEKI